MKAATIIAVWLVFAGVLLALWFGLYDTNDVQVPIRIEVEDTVNTKALGNKFVLFNGVSFSNDDGMGTRPVTVSSVQQFLSFTQRDANINVSFKKTDNYTVKRAYWSFTSNGDILLYEDIYKLDYYWVEKYTEDNVFFHYDNSVLVYFVLLAAFFVGVIISWSLSWKIARSEGTA